MNISFKKLLLSLICLVSSQVYAIQHVPRSAVNPARNQQKAVKALISAIDQEELGRVRVALDNDFLKADDVKQAVELAKDIYDQNVSSHFTPAAEVVASKKNYDLARVRLSDGSPEHDSRLALERAVLLLAPQYYKFSETEAVVVSSSAKHVQLKAEAQVAQKLYADLAAQDADAIDAGIANSLTILKIAEEKFISMGGKIKLNGALFYADSELDDALAFRGRDKSVGLHKVLTKFRAAKDFGIHHSFNCGHDGTKFYSDVIESKVYSTVIMQRPSSTVENSASASDSPSGLSTSDIVSASPAFTVLGQLIDDRESADRTPSLSRVASRADTLAVSGSTPVAFGPPFRLDDSAR